MLTGFSLQLLHASDLEAGLSAVEDAPNFAAVVQKLEESFPNTILLSSGDNFIPGPFLSAAGDSSLRQMFRDSTGNPTAREGVARADIQIMNVIGFDASALGNHEFDLQPSVLATAIAPEVTAANEVRWQGAQFPYLSANLDFSGDASLSPWDVPQGSPISENTAFVAPFNDATAARNTPKVAPSTFITVGGEKIGVIGLTTPLLRSISSPGPGIDIQPLNPEDLSALASIVNAEVNRLELIGSNKIILVSHLQQFSVEVALAPLLDGVDIIIAGGSDTRLADGDDILRPGDVAQGAYPILATSATNEPIAIVSTDGNYSYVGRLNADFDAGGILMVECLSPANSGAYSTDDAGVIRLWGNLTDPFLPGTKGAEVKEIVDAVAGVINTKDAVLAGQTGVYLEGRREQVRTEETNLGNITADANLAEVRKLVTPTYNGSFTRVSIKNGGGIRDSIGVIDSDTGALLATAGNPSAGKTAGQVSQLDIENSLRFNNALSLITVSAANLKRILEHGVAATGPGATPGQFPQVGGIAFSFDPTKTAQVITGNPGTGVATIATEGQRIRSLAIVDDDGNVADILVQDGQVVGDPNRQVQVVTLQFLIDDGDNDGRGGDNFPFPTFKIGNVVNTGIGEQAALKNYLSDNFPIGSNRVFNDFDTPAQLDERIQNLAVRSDTVIDRAIELQLLGRYQSTTGAEIVAHDPQTQKLFVVNGTSTLEVLDFNNPAQPMLIAQIDMSALGIPNLGPVNSVSIHNGVAAVAVEAVPKTDNGRVIFLDTTTHAVLNGVEVGALPDMLTFTPDGQKVVVANEGEPISYLTPDGDPLGTVSIIDVSGGIAAATVNTLDFSAYNGNKAALQAQGIRIFGPNASVAQDLEPEYVTISADSTKAYVTLQENNAISVVDLVAQSIVSLLPLGAKDHSGSSKRLETYTFQNLPDLGTTEFGDTIKLGGFSGLMFDGINPANGRYKFITHTDRGPNGVNTGDLRPFPLPDFAPELVRFEVDRTSGEIFVTERVQLKRGDGTLLTGLPNIAGTTGLAYDDEVPTDLKLNPLGTLDPLGADLEGIVKTPDGNFWMVDEYRPAIYQFDPNGQLIERFVPEGSPASTGTAVLPPVYAQRRSNRGFEAVAYSDGKLYAFIQSPLDNPDLTNDNTSKAGRVIRVLEFDLATKEPTGEYLYRLDTNAGGQVISDKIGDAVALGAGKFLVMERDDDIGAAGDKRVYSFSLANATNTLGLPNTFASVGGKTIEQMTDAELLAVTEVAGGLKVLNKTLFVDLIAAGYDKVDKAEGLALIDSNTIAVLNDNDFQVAGYNSTTGKITFSNTPAILGIITLDSNALDASDREVSSSLKRINIVPQPVKGLYMPDAIASFTVGGETFLVTANEGDARADWPGYNEEARISSIQLDNNFLPDSLKANTALGRLNITIASGDANNDGKFEELFAYGSRSFSIWTTEGKLVYDSADDFEKITAAWLPPLFNSNHEESELDNRSDNKGPEPEAVTTMVIGDRTYALIGLERVGGIMVYDVTNPHAPKYVQYFNDRFIGQTDGDLGPEGLIFIPAASSPTHKPLVVMASEVSNTVSVFGVFSTAPSAEQVGDTLVVQGTDANDYLAIIPAPGGKVEVKSGSTSLGVFDLAGLMQFKLYGYGGNDTLLVNPALNVNSLLSGGDGDDYLATGGGHDILLGGNGRDRLMGRGGADLIIGGEDIDLIFGGLDNDLLIGGTTAYDAQEAALFSILSQFQTSGLTPLLDSTTVFDDGDADSVFGEAGVDAFFLFTGDRSDRGRDAGE